MNAQPSFNTPPYSRHSRQHRELRRNRSTIGTSVQPKLKSKSTSLVHVQRRQGIEVSVKLVTYSVLSMFGLVNLAHSIDYNWSQQGKFQHLETELNDAQSRVKETNHKFNRSLDLRERETAMQENSYKFAPDLLPIVIASPVGKK